MGISDNNTAAAVNNFMVATLLTSANGDIDTTSLNAYLAIHNTLPTNIKQQINNYLMKRLTNGDC